VRRRTQFDLDKAKDRAHILEGLRIALHHIDKVIATIKKSKDKDEARLNLMQKFKMTERQAVAILEMRLQSLANLEQLKIETEYKEKMALIKKLEAILKSEAKILAVIRDEVVYMRDTYGDERRTKIVKSGVKEFSMEDIIANEPTIVLMTKDGYIKRLAPETFKKQARGGKGVIGLTTKEEDTVETLFSATTHQDLMFFTSRGRVFKLKVYEIPETSRTAKGQAIVNFLQLAPGEKVTAMMRSGDLETAKQIVMVTQNGTIKKTDIKDFSNVRRSGLIAIKLKNGDSLEWARPSTGKDDVILVTSQGMAIRFGEKDIRSMGRVASGVRGIRLKGDDRVVGMSIIGKDDDANMLMVVSSNGYGKRTKLTEYKAQNRGGQGIRTARITDKTGALVSASMVQVKSDKDLLAISNGGQVIRLAVTSISKLKRATQGVRIMRFKKAGDHVSSVTLVDNEKAAEKHVKAVESEIEEKK